MNLDAINQFNQFISGIFATFNLALKSGLGTDALSAVTAVTGAVATSGANPAADLAALTALNQVINDLIVAKKAVDAMPTNISVPAGTPVAE